MPVGSFATLLVSHLLYVLRYEAAAHFLVIRNEEEGFGLGGALCLHLLEAEVAVNHFPDLFNLVSREEDGRFISYLKFAIAYEIICCLCHNYFQLISTFFSCI